jgi:putative redox protein
MSLLNRKHDTSASSRTMRAVARQRAKYTHDLKIRDHLLTADEPSDAGGEDEGPSPQELLAASLASCTAITIEMYAKRKGWDVDGLQVDVDYAPAERGCPTRFDLVMKFPAGLSEDQVEKLQVIATKCPVHRVLEGEVAFEERVELT